MTPVVETILIILAICADVGFVGALITYLITAPWRSSNMGKWLLFLFFVLAVVHNVILLYRILPWDRTTVALVTSLIWAIAGLGIFGSILLGQLKNLRDREDVPAEDPPPPPAER